VISQAAVTRLASLKRGPINADSLGENLVFRKSADVKKVSNGSFQKKNVRYFATTRVPGSSGESGGEKVVPNLSGNRSFPRIYRERATGIEPEQKRRQRATRVFMKRPSVFDTRFVYPSPENEHNCAQLGDNSYAGRAI